MALHVKWSSGDQIWYDGTQTVFTIQDDDEGMLVGKDGDSVDFKFFGATTGAYMLFDESADLVDFHNINITYADPVTTVTTGSTGTLTLTATSNRMQFVSHGTGETTKLTLPAIADCVGIEFKIANTSASGAVTVLTTGAATVATVAISKAAYVFSDGVSWGANNGA